MLNNFSTFVVFRYAFDMKFLFALFLLFVLFVFLFGFSILRMLFGGLFGKPRRPEQKSNTSSRASTDSSKKIISSDEGEYVDYVEIKD